MKSHDRMISQLANYERDNEMINELYRVYGKEADDILYEIEDLYKQYNIDTATWGLVAWELSVGIKPVESMSYEQRRSRVKTKLKSHGKVATYTIQSAIQDYYVSDVHVEFDGKLLFTLPLEGESYKFMSKVMDIINRLKPAHLGYDIEVVLNPMNFDIFLGAFGKSGEEITVYPKIEREPEVYSDLYFSMAYGGLSEEVTVDGSQSESDISTNLNIRSIGNLINQLEQIVIHSNKGGDGD